MKKGLIFLLGLAVLLSCNEKKAEPQAPPEIPAQAIRQEIPELSIYNLPATWTTQDNEQIELRDLEGKVLAMVMIYTSCKAACPRLVADMRNLENQVPESLLDDIQFVMVSIDPDTDTPARLKHFAHENKMEEDHWLFLRGTQEDTREFAAVLAVSYKRISPMDFSHSNIISIFDETGVLVHQQEGLGVDNTETITAIKEELKD